MRSGRALWFGRGLGRRRGPGFVLSLVLALTGLVLPEGAPAQTVVLAQAPSPFDLIPRLDEAAQRVALGIVDTASAEGGLAVARNPFDIIRDGGRQPTVQRIDPIVAAGLERVPGTAVGAERSTFDTLLAFVLLVLLSVATLLQGGALRRIFGAVFNQNALSRLLREQQRGGYYVWAFLGTLVVASYVYVSVRELRPAWLSVRWSALDGFMLATLGLTLAKLGALQVLRAAFPLEKPVERYQMLILFWLGILGVVTFPLAVLVMFAPAPIAGAVAWAAGPIVAVAVGLRSVAAFAGAGRLATGYPLHFLLYLCALEIGPVLVMATWLARRVAPGSI